MKQRLVEHRVTAKVAVAKKNPRAKSDPAMANAIAQARQRATPRGGRNLSVEREVLLIFWLGS